MEETKIFINPEKPRKNNIQVIFLVLMFISIIIFSYTITILIKNIDLIKKDPIQFGIEKNNFYSCVCYSNLGTVFYGINTTDYINNADDLNKKINKKENTTIYKNLNITN